jgi:AraC-like DNA-binding protein
MQDEQVHGGILSGFCLIKFGMSASKLFTDSPGYKKMFTAAKPEEIMFSAKLLLNMLGNNQLTDTDYLLELEKKAAVQSEIADAIIEEKAELEKQQSVKTPVSLYKKQNLLLDAMRIFDKNAIKKHLNEVLGDIYLEGINNIELLKFRMLELFVLISRTMLDSGGNIRELYSITTDYIIKSREFNDIFDFSLWLKDLLNTFIENILSSSIKLSRISEAIKYIKQNYTSSITGTELASLTGLSESRFYHLFQEETGTTLTRYINDIRINKAKELLNTTPYKLAEIAQMLNFYDQSYFTKLFKSYTGQTPREYRTAK